jgi:hypothetical protein
VTPVSPVASGDLAVNVDPVSRLDRSPAETRLNERTGLLWDRTRDRARRREHLLRSLESAAGLGIDVSGTSTVWREFRATGALLRAAVFPGRPGPRGLRPAERRRLAALLRRHGLIEVEEMSRYPGRLSLLPGQEPEDAGLDRDQGRARAGRMRK